MKQTELHLHYIAYRCPYDAANMINNLPPLVTSFRKFCHKNAIPKSRH